MSDAFIAGRGVELRTIDTDAQRQAVLHITNQAPQNHFITHTPFSQDELEVRLDDESVMLFTVHESGSDAVSGFIMCNIEERDGRAELGVAIRDADQGNQYGTAATKELTNYAFERLPLKKVFGRRFGFNEPAGKVMRGCGFTEEAVIPNHRYSRGEMQDVVVGTLYRDDWEASPIYDTGGEAAAEASEAATDR